MNRYGKTISLMLLGFTGLFVLSRFLFGWMFTNIDSYFYYAIGEYFRTGTYPFQQPFVYIRPTTISPPLYGLFFLFTHGLPRADILLHAIQLTLLCATGYLLYETLRLHIRKESAIILACLFVLFPVNIVYADSAMTENASAFVVMLWTYLVATGIHRKNPTPIALAALVASVGTLLKYNLGIFIPTAFLFLIPQVKRIRPFVFLFSVFSILIIAGWIVANHTITGVWGLYDTRGTQLYNQFVAQTKLLPPENDPSVIRMRSLLPPGTDITVPYWDIQEPLSEKLGHDWLKIDKVLFDVAWASVRTHPFAYLLHSLKNYALVHYDHVPHWRNVGNMGRTDVTGTDRPFCGTLGSVTTCEPIINTPGSYTIWNAYMQTEMKLFEVFAAPVFFLVLLPSLIFLLIRGRGLIRLYALSYLVGTLPVAFTIHPDPRYVVPFYPLAVLLIALSAKTVLQNPGDVIWKKTKKQVSTVTRTLSTSDI